MASFNYDSTTYTNGVPQVGGTDLIDKFKIQLKNIPVEATLTIGNHTTDFETMNTPGCDLSGLTADVTLPYVAVSVFYDDPLKLPRIYKDTTTGKYSVLFTISAQTSFSYNNSYYTATKKNDVTINLVLDDLQGAEVDPTTKIVPIITASSAKLVAADKTAKYQCTIAGFSLKVSGSATITVPMVTQ